MKKCTKCQFSKSLAEFGPSRGKPGGFAWCKLCKQAYDKNRQGTRAYKTRKITLVKVRRRRNRKLVCDYLSKTPCVCGESRLPCLQFDHTRGTKSYTVSCMMDLSIGKIMEEIGKCTVRCANCHAMKTAEEQEWYNWA